jgi:hypothetical protein
LNKTFSNRLGKDFSGQQTSDGGYLLAGGTVLRGNGPILEMHLIKTMERQYQWEKIAVEVTSIWLSAQQTNNDGYIFAGGTAPSGKQYGLLFAKTDSSETKLEQTFEIQPQISTASDGF